MSNYYDEFKENEQAYKALVKSYQLQAEIGMRESIGTIAKEIVKECRKANPDKV